MAEAEDFKLFRSVNPATVNVSIKEKFAKLTLSSNKKKQQKQANSKATELASEATAHSNELTPKSLHSRPEELQLDVSDYMEVLQLSADGCTQSQDLEVEVLELSQRVSNLTVQSKQLVLNEVSICISSSSNEEEEPFESEESCITISDTSASENEAVNKSEQSIAISEQVLEPPPLLNSDKLARIEAFLRDVSLERHQVLERDQLMVNSSSEVQISTLLANAETESMTPIDECLAGQETILDTICSEELLPQTPERDPHKRLADKETEVNTICSEAERDPDPSKRLADDETEVNTICSEPELYSDPSKRLADNETEQNTLCSSLSDTVPDESLTIPETCDEAEVTPPRAQSAASCLSSSMESVGLAATPTIQVSSINISAKINIKIHIPHMDSSSNQSSEEQQLTPEPTTEYKDKSCQQQQQQQKESVEQKQECSDDAGSEDEEFLQNAEQLLNQLYGKAWQTPDVIRTLKRSSGSGGKQPSSTRSKRTPLNEVRRQPKALTTVKKKHAPTDESGLGDFSLFKRALHANKMNSTQLPQRQPDRRKRHVHEEIWRALVDSDSSSVAASDDEDANATDCSESGEDDNEANPNELTYLDLTQAEVQVVDKPQQPAAKENTSPKFPSRLDDILRTCRASAKAKLPATPTPSTPTTPTQKALRRQLFTPNTGYEDETTARRIVEQAVDCDALEELENIYTPGSAVHRRLQQVKQQLGLTPESPKSKPVFKFPPPQTAPPGKAVSRTKQPRRPLNTPQSVNRKGKCSFIKSLEPQVPREQCDMEAYYFREHFKTKRTELAQHLYDLYNEKVFDGCLNAGIEWSKKLRNTAGRCHNHRRPTRHCKLELSEKVLTSADRLRCTLIHEMCHAAAWIVQGASGHGQVWKQWTRRAEAAFPDLPPIRTCHSYDIEYKYTYKCLKCETTSQAHSNSRKVENLRCSLCAGSIAVFLNKKDKQGNVVHTPLREATGFAKFVKDNYQRFKQTGTPAPKIMSALSAEYARQKAAGLLNNVNVDIVDQVEALTIN
ncbi:uncharacterized protein LOC108604974 [Drosophila busckii]|uniref:uncharacterized protein LOC108604974 n=1 Tax=Drosophila busckii TaxID=30019 RepID=UPI0014330403|nr:uncharacterized protein LOC108604974 [Drosophila busckii]